MSGHGTTYRGRARHEHKLVPVPRELRVELVRQFVSRRARAEAVRCSDATADQLRSPFGVVRPEVIERAKAFLEERRKTGS